MATSSTSLVSSVVADILGYKATTAEDTAAAKAQDLSSTGYAAEATAYDTSSAIAERNAALEGAAGDIKSLQAARDVYQTVGSQRAAIAGAGFKNSGSALYQVRDSLQQGYLADQLQRTQTSVTQGGYLEEAAALTGLSKAATAAGTSATETAAAYRTAATAATKNTTDESAALTDYLKTYGTTAETNLVTGVLDTKTDLAGLNTTSANAKAKAVIPAAVALPTTNPLRPGV